MESTLDNADLRAPIRTMIEGWLEEAQEALDEEHALRQRLEEQRHINHDADERLFWRPLTMQASNTTSTIQAGNKL